MSSHIQGYASTASHSRTQPTAGSSSSSHRRGNSTTYRSTSSPVSSPRFSNLFNTVLGSPFLTTDLELGLDLDLVDGSPQAVPRTQTITRPSSPAPTADYSIIDLELDDDEARYPYKYAYRPYGRHTNAHGRSASTITFGRRGLLSSNSNTTYNGSSFKSFLPRIWEAFSSPSRNLSSSPSPLSSPPSTPSPPHTRYNTYAKGKAPAFDFHYSTFVEGRYVDYRDLPPLDGEEGELIAIDDEACFIDVRAVTGIDILSLLPTELALYILILLCAPTLPSKVFVAAPTPPRHTTSPHFFPFTSRSSSGSTITPTHTQRHSITSSHIQYQPEVEDAQFRLRSILACRAVSRIWRTLASDNTVWRALFIGRWDVDLRRAGEEWALGPKPSLRPSSLASFRPPAIQIPQFLTPASTPSPMTSGSISASVRTKLTLQKKKVKGFLKGGSGSGSSSTSPSPSPPPLPHPGFRPTSPGSLFYHQPSPSRLYSPHRPHLHASSSRLPGLVMPSPALATRSYSLESPHTRLIPPTYSQPSSPKLKFTQTSLLSRPPSAAIPVTYAPLRLNWRVLYRERMELDKRWMGTALLDQVALPPTVDVEGRQHGQLWEPKVMRISGHTDSVYCLEFDSKRIITGSRDRSIKVWSLRTGRLLGSFWGAHRGSILCLKFEGNWDRDWDDNDSEDGQGVDSEDDMGDVELSEAGHGSYEEAGRRGGNKPKTRRGFMVSGSSDHSICVWDLYTGRPVVEDRMDGNDLSPGGGLPPGTKGKGKDKENVEREVKANVRAVLKGHQGGVLDLRIDHRWIVSCSKDAVIYIWDRKTLELHQTLRGHEGPVNAVGLQGDQVVSASGDGRMILWDVETGERQRTFEGHDRGLACIEFKDDLIVSGSNDCKIKVWSASTGECLRTLVGHEALVRALSFAPRSGMLVSGSYDKTVKVWDLYNGKLIREFKNTHTSHIFDVKFDVARIVSTSHDQKIIVLDFSHGLDTTLFV